HFEKMLYDNAQLVRVYLRASELLSQEEYEIVAEDTLRFMQRELMSKKGAMSASLSAIDSNNIEGGYYLWRRDELKQLLNRDELEIIEAAWLSKGPASFDAGYHPLWVAGASAQQELTVAKQKLLSSARLKMLKKRQQDRQLPLDDKLLAGWNGLALSAFSEAASVLNNSEFRKTADTIAKYITDTLLQDGKLIRARKAGKILGKASLADYAFVAEGLWDHYLLSKSKTELLLLQKIVNTAWEQFYTPSGWSLGSTNAIESDGRQGIIPDGPLASPSSTLLAVSYKLAKETDDDELEKMVQTALGYDAFSLSSDAFWYATQVRVINEVFSQ
ncbi:MAG: thioredoxin domain-containing protein, partial [Gammaproteobacteria bacterium]|nr:thioredoxin domain-containing protein [Gammaproteobacteria bacterium]